MTPFYPLKWAIVASITLLVIALINSDTLKPAQAGSPSINITSSAVQTIYQNGVPHTDRSGNIRTTYDPNLSFFPNGIFNVSTETKDQHAVQVLANAGFNMALNFRGDDPQFYINQISGPNQYTVAILPDRNTLTLLAVATAADSSATIDSPNLTAGGKYFYLVCTPNCAEAKPIAYGDVTATQGPNSQGRVSVSWDTGASFKLLINNELQLDANRNYDASTFNESLFSSYKSNPSVVGWWLADEPYNIAKLTGQDPTISYNAISQVYQSHKDLTTQVIFIDEAFNNAADNMWKSFVNLTDLGDVYSYPKFFTQPIQTFQSTAQAAQSTVQAVSAAKPAWLTPQLFHDGGGYLYLTPTEERAQVYTAIIHGATGFLHFSWDSCKTRNVAVGIRLVGVRPDLATTYADCPAGTPTLTDAEVAAGKALWNSLSAQENGINSELKQLTPILLSPTDSTNYSVFVDQTPISAAPIRTMLKQYNNEYYLLAVNIDNATISSQFEFPFTVGGPVTKLFEAPQVVPQGTKIVDAFSPFQVHIYKFSSQVDTDQDGFIDSVETGIGTDPNSKCVTISGTDAWPPDTDKDAYVTINDVMSVAKNFGRNRYESTWSSFKRFDLDNSGAIEISDVMLVAGYYGRTCRY